MKAIKMTGLTLLYAVLIVAMLAGLFGWSVLQWNECKAMGHSTLYCIGHVMK